MSYFAALESGGAASFAVKLDVQNLSYGALRANKELKIILHRMSFSLESGDMCAICGPSGAGKSTLLDLIADRKKIGVYSGKVLVNNQPRGISFQQNTAYVMQSDLHIPTLTVEETIRFSAWTRMSESTTGQQMEDRVSHLLNIMHLIHVKNSLVGDSLNKGISGGELKRLSIAVEIVHFPALICLDEPTSGLDSSVTLEIMSSVRKICDRSHICICTIHQPSPQVFSLFDRLIVVSDGRLVYFGSLHASATYFSGIGYTYDPEQNLSEFVLDICGGSAHRTGDNEDYFQTGEELEQLFISSKTSGVIAAEALETEPVLLDNGQGLEDKKFTSTLYNSKYATSTITQIRMLLARSWLAESRNKASIRAALAKHIVLGLLAGTIFFGQGDISEPLVNQHSGYLLSDSLNVTKIFFIFVLNSMMGNLQRIPTLCDNNSLYRREQASSAYTAAAYWVSILISDIPLIVLTHTIQIGIMFLLCKFPLTISYFAYLYFNTLMANMVSFYFAQFLALSTQSAEMAFLLFPLTLMFFLLFAGFAVPIDKLPDAWSWAPFVSYARYSFEGLVVNEFERFTMDGSAVLRNFSFDEYDKMDTFWILAIYIVVIDIATYYFLLPDKSMLINADLRTIHNNNDTVGDINGSIELRNVGKMIPDLSGIYKHNLSKSFHRQTIDDHRQKLKSRMLWANFERFSDMSFRAGSSKLVQIDPAPGFTVLFTDVRYSITVTTSSKELIKKDILRGVSGQILPGEICGFLGASGAGKSSLLDILANRKTVGEITGKILFDGMERTPAIMKSTAYVLQDNVNIPYLTVRQTLLYAAHLRMSETVSLKHKQVRITKLMEILGLSGHENDIVGGETIRGLSGGEVKRLSIAVEIINLPKILFLDEPTTGLDSSLAFQVFFSLRNVASQQRTILSTIHSPSTKIFEMLDKLLLIAHGRVIYFGLAKSSVAYFTSSPFGFSFARLSNPADFIVSIAGSFEANAAGKYVTGDELADYYNKSDDFEMLVKELTVIITAFNYETERHATTDNNKDVSEYINGTIFQITTLLKRKVDCIIENPKLIIAPLIRCSLLSVLVFDR